MSTIQIVGGGIAGLALAATLQRPTWDVLVHEHRHRPDEREVGTAFGLWPPAMAALDQLGIGEAVRDHGVAVSTATVRTADDRALMKAPRQDVVMIARTTLHHLLHAAVPASVQQHSGRVSDSRALTGNVIVGADGAHSVVRRDHWGRKAAARARGTTVIRGVIEGDLARREVTEYWSNGQLFGITPSRQATPTGSPHSPNNASTASSTASTTCGRPASASPRRYGPSSPLPSRTRPSSTGSTSHPPCPHSSASAPS